jgi:hypothetical protein
MYYIIYDCIASFTDLIERVGSYELALCSIAMDNLSAQASGPDELLLATDSPVLYIKCFAHLANLVFIHILRSPYFSEAMNVLTEVQSSLRKAEEIGRLV